MWKLEIDHVLRHLVDATLPRFSPPDKGLLVSLDLRVVNYLADDEHLASRLYHLVYQRPSNYTKVFGAESDNCFALSKLGPDDWSLLVDHDSCWTTAVDRPLNRLWKELRDAVQSEDDRFNTPQPTFYCYIQDVREVGVSVSKNADRSADVSKRYRLLEVTYRK